MNQKQTFLIDAGRGWLALDKPAGLSVHNDPTDQDVRGLVRDLLAGDAALRSQVQPEVDFPPAPVHRLDAGTSGVLLVAVRREQARQLAEEFASRSTRKIYAAVIKGSLPAGDEWREWNQALADGAAGRRDPAGARHDQRPSQTRWQVLESGTHLSLLRASPVTGRQHQIRRHAALAGYPIVGDRRYGNPKHADLMASIYGFDRLALHAEELEIPIGGRPVLLKAAVPADFYRLLRPPPSTGDF